MQLIYPACFYPFEDDDQGYVVEVPDLLGCVTEGDTLEEAIKMAIDAASGWVLNELEAGNQAPKPSQISQIMPEAGGFVSLIVLDMDSYTEKYGNKSVRKNLTIPAWLNTFAEKNHINFSQVLQNSLVAMYTQGQNGE